MQTAVLCRYIIMETYRLDVCERCVIEVREEEGAKTKQKFPGDDYIGSL